MDDMVSPNVSFAWRFHCSTGSGLDNVGDSLFLNATTVITTAITFVALTTDVGLDFPRISIPQVIPRDDLQIASTSILFRLDSIAQEGNETLNLTFFFQSGELGRNPTLLDSFSGVVVDATRN